jgi:putative ATP-binding cassette transporter
VDRLTLEIKPGERWLITSADDTTKVSLFRATAGVWEHGSGKIIRPGLEDILFLPERPYLPPGALRDVLLRTGQEHVINDAQIMEVLSNLGLRETVTRAGGLGASKDWDDVFSIGEQHMLSIARLFLAHPKFVFLDRPGSSLPHHQIGVLLDKLVAEGIGVVVLAKNGESKLHYDAQLDIRADGSWKIRHRELVAAKRFELHDLSC